VLPEQSFAWLAACARRDGFEVTRGADGVLVIRRWGRLLELATVTELQHFLERAGALGPAPAGGNSS
jgi:hypothetical protein